MAISLRADRVLFRFSGPEAHRLLNDVLTGHIPETDGPAAWWALLSPQGKILAEGLAGWMADALWLDVHQSVADDFFKRMRMYKLRAKVDIEDLRDTHRVGFSEVEVPGAQRDRLGPIQIGWRLVAPVAEIENWIADDSAYQSARIAAGLLHQGNDFPANDAFAHDLGMDLLEGIDFAKGCYVGQEVVSRMKHRGTARRRPVIISGIDAPAGIPVIAGGREAGTIGQAVNGKAVAPLRLDRIGDLKALTVNGAPVSAELPSWANYEFGGASAGDD